MRIRHLFFLLPSSPAVAFAGMQSALDPKGKDAAQIYEITWVLFSGGTLVFAAVLLLLGIALFGPPAMRAALAKRNWIIGGGVVFPVTVLTLLLLYTFVATSGMVRGQDPPAARIEITGELWWWRVRYLDAQGKIIAEAANEIHLPVGQPVELLLRSDNIIHSFWVPNLAGKTDMIPGRVNRLRIQANEPGVYRGQCAEYCGAQHANMAFYAVVHTANDYAAWLDAQIRPAQAPSEPALKLGKNLFINNRCGLCHTIRGTAADGTLGPDLTHVGSRLSLASGVLANNQGSLAGWIAGSQHLKPDNKMPSFNQFSGEELRAIAAYLESLQ